MIYLPLALPGTVLAFVMFHLLSGAGLLSRMMASIGLVSDPAGFPNLVNDPYGLGIIIAEVAIGAPFFMILFAQLYESERLHDLAALAEVLGADRRKSMRRIIIPVLLRRSFPTIVLYMVAVLGAYEVPLLLGPQSPQMISVLTMRKYAMFDLAQKPEAFICALLYTCVASAAIAFAYRRAGSGEE
jgi:putative spermidine/putrescine transport system permease protein